MLVGDLMVDAKSDGVGSPVRRVIELLLDDDVDSIPVLSSQGRLEGLVTAGMSCAAVFLDKFGSWTSSST